MKKVWMICAAGVLAVGLGAATVHAAGSNAPRSCAAGWTCGVQTQEDCTKDCTWGDPEVCPQNCGGNHDGVCTGGQYCQDDNGDGICDNAGACPQNCDGNHDGVCTGGQYYRDDNGDGICDNAGVCPQNCDGNHDGVCTGGQNYGNHGGHHAAGGHHGGHT